MYRNRKIERNKIVVMLINKGLTYTKISKIFNITRSRVKDINKVHNSEIFRNEAVKCVNCGLTACGNYNSKHFLFENDPINICMSCVEMFRGVNNFYEEESKLQK